MISTSLGKRQTLPFMTTGGKIEYKTPNANISDNKPKASERRVSHTEVRVSSLQQTMLKWKQWMSLPQVSTCLVQEAAAP